MAESPWLTVREAAAHLGLTPTALYHKVEDGTIPTWCYRRLGRLLRFRRGWLDEWLDGDKRLRRAG